MKRAIGSVVLGLSACGYPLTQVVVRRWGVRGAAVAESVCAGLAIRDASMVASGVPGRLRRVPAALLRRNSQQARWPRWPGWARC